MTNVDLQSKLGSLEQLILIQADCVNGDTGGSGYMHGMLNGLICAQSVITGDDPVYYEKHKHLTKIRHKQRKKQ